VTTSQMKSGQRRTFYELNWFLIATILFAIFMPLISNFLGWDDKEILEQRHWMLYWYYSICIVIGSIAFMRYGIIRLAKDRYRIVLLMALLSFLCSILFGLLVGVWPSPMVVMAPFFTILIFHVFTGSVIDKDLVIGKWLLIAFLLAPLLILSSPSLFQLPFNLYTLDSFRGFSSSRTDYGYLLGILVLILLVQSGPSKWVILPATFLALVLSENRAAFFAVIISLSYLAATVGSRRSAVFVWILLFVGALGLASIYLGIDYLEKRGVTFFDDSGDRMEIVVTSLERAFDKNFLFGAGAFYQNVDVSSIGRVVEPHNSILQSILNFGLIPTLLWYALLATTYFKFRPAGRSFLLYWFVFGLFHPGYDAFLFTPESMVPLLLAVHFSHQTGLAHLPLRFTNRFRARPASPVSHG
jgi:hypothetical protein